MSLKNKAFMMLAATMALTGGGLPSFGDNSRRPEKLTPKRFGKFITEIPKGHKIDSFMVEFTKGNYKYSALIQFTFGSDNTREKRRIKREKEAVQYLIETPHESIFEFEEFRIDTIQCVTPNKDK